MCPARRADRAARRDDVHDAGFRNGSWSVAAFLDRRIRFDQIHGVNLATLEAVAVSNPQSLEELLAVDARARESAHRTVARMA